MNYTNEKKLTVADLKRLRDKYNGAGEFADSGFMNELFHGLDSLINTLERIESIDILVKEYDKELDSDEKTNILDTLIEILKNEPINKF